MSLFRANGVGCRNLLNVLATLPRATSLISLVVSVFFVLGLSMVFVHDQNKVYTLQGGERQISSTHQPGDHNVTSGVKNMNGDSEKISGNSANGSSTTSGMGQTPSTSHVQPIDSLVVTPSTIVIGQWDSINTVTISTNDGMPLSTPSIARPSDAFSATIYPQSPPPSFSGGIFMQKQWDLEIRQVDLASSGQGYITISVPNASWLSAKVLVKWSKQPHFYATKGSITRTDNAKTITYVAHMTLVPSDPYFGSPTITLYMFNAYECINANPSNHTLTTSFTYNGNNDLTIDCVVNRRIAGSIPPTMDLSFSVSVDARLSSGQSLFGTVTYGYIVAAPYDI